MAKLNRTCGICKDKYSYCPTCAADAHKPTWMAVFCSENCREFYNVINDYKHKKVNNENAYKKLKALDLSSLSKLPENFKLIVDEILRNEHQIKIKVSEDAREELAVLEDGTMQDSSIVNEVLQEVNEQIIQSEVDEIVEIKKPRAKRKVKIVE